MMDDHRKNEKFVREHGIACLSRPKIPLTYIEDEGYETRSARSTECSLDEVYFSNSCNGFGRDGDILFLNLHYQGSLVMVSGSDGLYLFY